MTSPSPSPPPAPPPQVRLRGPTYSERLAWDRRQMLWYLFGAIVLHMLLRSSTSLLALGIVAAGTAGAIVWPFLRNTYVLHRQYTRPRTVRYAIADSTRQAELSPRDREALTRMGFEFVACLERVNDVMRASTVVGLYINRDTGDSAQVALVQNSYRAVNYNAFNTRFTDGGSLETTTSSLKPIYKPTPLFVAYRFPQVRQLSDLYRLHQALLQEQSARERVAAALDTAVAAFQEASARIHSLNAEQGDFRLNATGDWYVLTWPGAFRHASVQTWPIPELRRRSVVTEANRVAKRLGYRIHPTFGTVEPVGQND